MMATTSSTAKNKPDNQNLTRSRSLGPKPKPVPPSNADGSGQKTVEKPLPNYLKPTVNSRPDPVKFLRKNKAVEDSQKLLRRRSFDRPLSSSSTSSTHKSLNTSPPARPREKPVTGLRSTSFHGSSSRCGLRGSTAVKSPPVASRGPPGAKKSGLSGTSSSKSKKEGSENVPRKSLGKEITPECYPPAPDHEDEKEIVKIEIDVQVSDDHTEEGKDQVAQTDESTEEEKGELINEEQTEEQKETENTGEEEEVEKKVDVEEISETVVTPDMKEAEVKEEERERNKVKEGTRETDAYDDVEERTKKEVVKGKRGPPTVYNDVIASKMQESSRKNKVLALAGAFQTVIDYETAASK